MILSQDCIKNIKSKKEESMKLIIRKIKIYLSYFKIKFNNEIQYKIAAIAGVITQFAWGAMYIMLYSTFLKNGSSANMDVAQISTYIWLQQACYMIYNTWSLEKEVLEGIQTGNVSMELIRPINIYEMWHSKTLARKLAMGMLRGIPLVILCLLLPLGQYKLMLPVNFIAFVLFFITFVLSIFLMMSYVMLMYATIMYTLGSNGVKIIFQLANEFFAGAIIPISFMPNMMQTILKFTPFYYMQNIPLNIYTGYYSNYKEIFFGIIIQMLWIVVLNILGRKLISRRVKKIVVQGG